MTESFCFTLATRGGGGEDETREKNEKTDYQSNFLRRGKYWSRKSEEVTQFGSSPPAFADTEAGLFVE